MRRLRSVLLACGITIGACSSPDSTTTHVTIPKLNITAGNNQTARQDSALVTPLQVTLADSTTGTPVAGVVVNWTVNGDAQFSSSSSTTDANGVAVTNLRLGHATMLFQVHATVAAGPSVLFTENAVFAPTLQLSSLPAQACIGVRHALNVFAMDSLGQLAAPGAVTLSSGDADDLFSALTPGVGGQQVSAVKFGNRPGAHTIHASAPGFASAAQVVTVATPCPRTLMAFSHHSGDVNLGATDTVYVQMSNDSGAVSGLTVTARLLSGPGAVVTPPLTTTAGPASIITTTTAMAGDQVLEIAAGGAADTVTLHVLPGTLLDLSLTARPGGTTNSQGVTVRDGYAFFAGADKGVVIYDIGNGSQGGSPTAPHLVSQVVPSLSGISQSSVWFHNPVSAQNRYLFITQAASGAVQGGISVVDVSDLTHPVEVATLRIDGASPGHLWIDEPNQVLYAAYHGAGVIKVDISGALAGDISARITARVQPGGATSTDANDVTLSSGTVFYSDERSGLWALDPATLATKGGGHNGSPFQTANSVVVGGNVAYTGMDDCDGPGFAYWSLAADGTPTFSAAHTTPDFPCKVGGLSLSPDHKLLAIANYGAGGLWVYDVSTPLAPVIRAIRPLDEGFASTQFAMINGHLYLVAVTNDSTQGMLILDAGGAEP